MSVIGLLQKLRYNRVFGLYAKNTAWMVAEKVVRVIVGLLVGVWVARYLGADRYGGLCYAISFIAIFSVFSNLGLDNIVVRELVKGGGREEYILGASFFLKFVGAAIVVTGFLFYFIFYAEQKSESYLMLILVVSLLFHSVNVLDFYFQSKTQNHYVAIAKMVGVLISASFKIVLILWQAPLVFFAFTVAVESVVLAVMLIYFYRGFKTKSRWRVDKTTCRRLLTYSWPLMFSSFFIFIYMKIDQIMIGEIVGLQAVGYYAVAVQMSEVWYFIPVIISAVSFPVIVKLRESDIVTYELSIMKIYFFLVWFSIVMSALIYSVSDHLIRFFYGEAYHISGGVLKIHIWASIFVFLGVVASRWMLCEGLAVYSVYSTVFGAILNVVLNYFFLDDLGAKGAAFATLISYFFSGYACFFIFKKTRSNFYLMSSAFNPYMVYKFFK